MSACRKLSPKSAKQRQSKERNAKDVTAGRTKNEKRINTWIILWRMEGIPLQATPMVRMTRMIAPGTESISSSEPSKFEIPRQDIGTPSADAKLTNARAERTLFI
jgi:hypothetical protein